MPPRLAFVVIAVLRLATPLQAQTAGPERSADLALQIAAITTEPAVSRTHWGVMVTALDGIPIYSLNEGQLFQPASNTKLFTTAAALALIPQMTFQTRLAFKGLMEGRHTLNGDLILIGDGDANLSGRPVPFAPASKPAPPLRFLEEMADAVAASGLKRIDGDIVGDDSLFPWEPYATDWAIDDALWGYGAPVSALTINDNQIKVTLRPGAAVGDPAVLTLDPDIDYYLIDTAELKTTEPKSPSHIEIERPMGSKTVRIHGTLALDAAAYQEELAIEDPAEYAATALASLLRKRGIVIAGIARPGHQDLRITEGFLKASREPLPGLNAASGHADGQGVAGAHPHIACDPAHDPVCLASHISPTVAEDVVITNKESQNLHAELLLHHLAVAFAADGSTAQGARVVRSFLISAGIDKDDFVFFDGSGMSGHNLVTPRAIAKLLQFASTQPWFAAYKASLPVGGVDGSLESRFTKPPLKGHVFAKTGTNSETRALSGYLDCASGKTVIFSVLAGDHFPSTSADREAMDRIVAAIAAAN
jgi:D-alanyl-D-alanine carboxypeptidase/D-alanyl-D-alanine-endopeptidase (penicillin-binding protein 4)